VLGLTALAAGCGGTGSLPPTENAPSTTPTAATGSTATSAAGDCLTPAARRRQLARLAADTSTLRRLSRSARPPRDPGPLALQRATDRFLLHMGMSHLGYKVRNRLTDHAAAAVAFSCHACFVMLENERPVPAIAYGGSGRCPA
jgi:hypothetical protein